MKEIFTKEAFGIIGRLKRRDFSGNTGLAVKNSIFQILSIIALKGGSILFTIIVARMLLPDLFGLYSLALNTIVLISAFSDLGVGTTLIRFVSRELAKKRNNAGSYVDYLLKIKMRLTMLVSFVIIVSAYFLANVYYHKPIFFALIAGGLYIIFNSLSVFYSSLFQALNKFQINVYKEIIFQIARLILVPSAILLMVGKSTEVLLFFIFLAISISYAIGLVYLYICKPNLSKSKELLTPERKEVLRLILPLSATTISALFFGYVDTVMLGGFVESKYIGYYSAAMMLVSSISSLMGFSSALFPIFSRLNKEKLKLGLKKVLAISVPLCIIAIIATIFLSNIIVLIIYGSSFSPAVFLMQILSFIILLDPLISIYTGYHIAMKNQGYVAKYLLITAILNIGLNLLFITQGLRISQYSALIGAAIAIFISRIIYLGFLMSKRSN